MTQAHNTHSFIPFIFVETIYGPTQRKSFQCELSKLMAEFDIGVPRLCCEIQQVVSANNKRIKKIDGSTGLHVDQLSSKNMYHFFADKRSDDARIQILDAYLQIKKEDPPASRLMV